MALSNAFDPALANLYADSARVWFLRHCSDGVLRDLPLSGVQYKRVLATAMPMATAGRDVDQFSNVSYHLERDGAVLIRARRTSPATGQSAPHLGGWLPVDRGADAESASGSRS